MRRRDAEHEAELDGSPGVVLAKEDFSSGAGGDRSDPHLKAASDARIAERGDRALALRAEGLTWRAIAVRLGVSDRQVRLAAQKRAPGGES